MDNAEKLLEIESIKQLKARYCRLLDAKDWERWRELFADDFHSDTADSGGKEIVGADDFVAFVRKALGKPTRATVHQIHGPEIELTSPTTATGVWALEDVVRFGFGLNMKGYGHYHECYEKVDGLWKIKYSKLTRLREDYFNGLFAIYIANWFRNWLLRKINA
ncbi:nuclear transport factor 2 family protein [Litorivivens sp.]|uniref:nuclear transport factor 2 family protein n=1 Tax=Litorivivens sp. TaxID=2020868 RepID=UPI00356A04EC